MGVFTNYVYVYGHFDTALHPVRRTRSHRDRHPPAPKACRISPYSPGRKSRMRVRERRRPDGRQGRRQRHRTARVLSTPAHGETGALHGRPFRAKICQAACRAILGSALHGPQVSDTLTEPPNGPSRWGLPSLRSTFNVHQPGGLSPSRYATRGDPSCAWRMVGTTVSRRSPAFSPMVGRTHCLHGGAGLVPPISFFG
jgi:hypothetical protein